MYGISKNYSNSLLLVLSTVPIYVCLRIRRMMSIAMPYFTTTKMRILYITILYTYKYIHIHNRPVLNSYRYVKGKV